ncbi:MAG: hypothetical protein PHE68_04320 [Candidatus Peribacteraceae bacterium]|nr:hypothetical protein [Candidatus Peribacteraceae bacterium]MDD5074741.1 hypothetical protein [Candidatus Peribacteraceae bacterium]
MKKIILSFLAGIIVTAGGIFVYQKAQEDTWLCQNGQWVKHGNPTNPMPIGKCGAAGSSGASSLKPVQSSSAKQSVASLPASKGATTSKAATKTFTAADFEITYPDWAPLPPTAILEPANTKVGVRNAGCGFIVTVRQLPAGDQFKPFIEKLIAEQVKASNVTILKKELGDAMMHVEGEFPVGARWASTSQYGYLTKGRQLYSVVFASEKSVFATACTPFVKATIASIKVK